jgi:hypothetical protein
MTPASVSTPPGVEIIPVILYTISIQSDSKVLK